MTEKLFENALGIAAPWHVAKGDFNAKERTLTIHVDFVRGSRFRIAGAEGLDFAEFCVLANALDHTLRLWR